MTLLSRVYRLPGLAALALLTLTLPFRTAQAQLGSDYVRVEVKVDGETDKKPAAKPGTTPAPNAAPTVNQDRTLQILLSGKPRNPETRKGKWTVYSKSLKDKDVMMVDSGEFKLELPPNGQQKVESKKVVFTYSPAHVTGVGANGRGVGKKVEPTGSKYYGYSIIIKDGETVVSETYDPPGLKQELTRK